MTQNSNKPQMAESGAEEKDDGDDDGKCVVMAQLTNNHQVTHINKREGETNTQTEKINTHRRTLRKRDEQFINWSN